MNAPLPHPLNAASGPGDWMLDRMTEARGILADLAQHPETLVVLAARVVAGRTGDAGERADAFDVLRLLDRRALHGIAAAALANGGAA
jgi:hypothetical protein